MTPERPTPAGGRGQGGLAGRVDGNEDSTSYRVTFATFEHRIPVVVFADRRPEPAHDWTDYTIEERRHGAWVVVESRVTR